MVPLNKSNSIQIINLKIQMNELTQNGIEKLLKGETIVAQIINTVKIPLEKKGQVIDVIIATVNDGYAYYESIYLQKEYFNNSDGNFHVIKVKLSQGSLKKLAEGRHKPNEPLVTDNSSIIVVTNKVNRKIGNPICYAEYIKNGRKNPKGNRKIYDIGKYDEEDDTEDDLFNEAEKLRQKMKEKEKLQNKGKSNNVPTMSKKSQNINSNNNSRSVPIKKENDLRPTINNRQNSISNAHKSVEQPKNKPNKPIVKIEQPEKGQPKRNSIKPQVKHHDGDHQKIKELFVGIQSFRLVVRLLFVLPIKTYTNRKGVQSQLLNMQFGDETGTIMCTVFGDNASRYCTLEVDKIYSITGANVSEANYKGVTEMKLNFNDGTKVDITHDNKTIPTVDKFCLSLKELNQTEKGRIVNVKCLLKQADFTQFVSKNGNNVKKKILKMYDIDNQLQSQLTLFNDKAEMDYPQGMYAIKGVQVDQYQGNKQFKNSMFNFCARYLKGHAMNKRIKEVQDITFTSIASNQKSKRQNISSFSVLNQKAESLNDGENLWSEVVCYLKGIRSGSKNAYISCPHCRKKPKDENATTCEFCHKDFDKLVYRYMVQVNLMDDHDNIWAMAYDEGQKILNKVDQQTFTADSFMQLSQDQLRQRVQQIRYKQLKVKIVSNKDEYNGEKRLKHKVVKVLPLVYAQQCKTLLQRIKSATSSL